MHPNWVMEKLQDFANLAVLEFFKIFENPIWMHWPVLKRVPINSSSSKPLAWALIIMLKMRFFNYSIRFRDFCPKKVPPYPN